MTTARELIAQLRAITPANEPLCDALAVKMRGGRPMIHKPDDEAKFAAVRAAILRTLGKRFASRTDLLRTVKNYATAADLRDVLAGLEFENRITKQEDHTRPGRPCTMYALSD